jgi:tRNA threonylcarbamoyladenosine biosynthesis protein TsaE
MTSLQTHSSDETTRLGRTFASSLRPGDVVALTGDLGTGKTHFIIGVCEGLGVRGHVASPTFTLVNEYAASGCTVVHVDLYRIMSMRELEGIGVEEYFNERYICLIEWAERLGTQMPRGAIRIHLAHGESESDRVIVIEDVRHPVAVRDRS